MLPAILTAHRRVPRFKPWERGQGLVEYVLVLALIAVVAIASVSGLGQAIVTKLYALAGSL